MAITREPQKPALTRQAHDLIRAHFARLPMHPNIAIDATCGNGNDTVFLATISSQVFAFDIQARALEMTQEKLSAANLSENVTLLHTGHQHLSKHVLEEVDCIMFNLGYLPQADKSITTVSDTTLGALNASLKVLNPEHGILSILCYPGHSEGQTETLAVKNWLNELSDPWTLTEFLSNHPGKRAPILYLITP